MLCHYRKEDLTFYEFLEMNVLWIVSWIETGQFFLYFNGSSSLQATLGALGLKTRIQLQEYIRSF